VLRPRNSSRIDAHERWSGNRREKERERERDKERAGDEDRIPNIICIVVILLSLPATITIGHCV